jgi:hypothetical protein
MADCTNCGRSLSDVARFCPGCGMAVQQAPVEQAPAAVSEAEVSAAEPLVDPVVEPAVETAVDPAVVAEPAAAPGPDTPVVAEAAAETAAPPAAEPAAAPAPAPDAGVRCATCGAAVPEGDLFCGECGTPVGPAAAAPPAGAAQAPYAAAAAAVPVYASQPAQPQPAAQPGIAPAYQPPYGSGQPRAAGASSFADYLSFTTLFTGTAAVAVFWVAEGANLLYWILNWIYNRYGGPEAFLWSAAGFVLFAIVIRILVEAAVSANRVKDEIAALRKDDDAV